MIKPIAAVSLIAALLFYSCGDDPVSSESCPFPQPSSTIFKGQYTFIDPTQVDTTLGIRHQKCIFQFTDLKFVMKIDTSLGSSQLRRFDDITADYSEKADSLTLSNLIPTFGFLGVDSVHPSGVFLFFCSTDSMIFQQIGPNGLSKHFSIRNQ